MSMLKALKAESQPGGETDSASSKADTQRGVFKRFSVALPVNKLREAAKGAGKAESRGAGLGAAKGALTEFLVIAILLAIPSKIIWDMRDSSLRYIASTKAERAATQAQIAQGRALLTKTAKYKGLLAQEAVQVPKTVEYSQVVSTITTLAEHNGVELDTVSAPSKRPSPLVAGPGAGAVYEWTVDATITGPLPQIQSYIDALQAEPRLYQVTQAQLGVAGVGTGAGAKPAVGTGAAPTFQGSIDTAILAIDVESLS